jgi:hypothetical protein
LRGRRRARPTSPEHSTAGARGRSPSLKRPSAGNFTSRTMQRSRFGSPTPKHAEWIGALTQ